MKNKSLWSVLLCWLLMGGIAEAEAQKEVIYKPWTHGALRVSENKCYLMHTDGTPFFWQGETGWLLPERLNRDEADYYFTHCRRAGFNVVQVQTMNDVPAINVYGQYSLINGFDFGAINRQGVYGYWDHMDYIIRKAEENGIYVAMVCIWGGLVRGGKMNAEEAEAYGQFLGERYKNAPNIVWVIGGDTYTDRNIEVWRALARSIRKVDAKHLMTFHPFGRTSSATKLNGEEWMDFNMFQSGHRRYGQTSGRADDGTEEDNWRYVEEALAMQPLKPVLDGEPSYEDIPHGLHDPSQPRWQAKDVRRYAYWSVFAGACGHTYGHNNIMQFLKPGVNGAYGADGTVKPWYVAMKDPGFQQMRYVKNLILTFPYFERVPDQTVIAGGNGERYERLAATRGEDYLLVYNHTGQRMSVDLTRIRGERKRAWWYDPTNGQLTYIGEFKNRTTDFTYEGGTDRVLIVTDAGKSYVSPSWTQLPVVRQ